MRLGKKVSCDYRDSLIIIYLCYILNERTGKYDYSYGSFFGDLCINHFSHSEVSIINITKEPTFKFLQSPFQLNKEDLIRKSVNIPDHKFDFSPFIHADSTFLVN